MNMLLQTHVEVAEFIRSHFVQALRSGENLCYDIGSASLDFNALTVDGVFDPHKFFNFAWMNETENYSTFMRDDENDYDLVRSKKFSMTIRIEAADENRLNE